ncbi:MAG: O-antigen ligase family protein [Planctomycetes bacterium]|nr:O-antigen ligase family protein [Planctomycetota bacterium]
MRSTAPGGGTFPWVAALVGAAAVACGVAGSAYGAGALGLVAALAILGASFARPLVGVLGLMVTQLYLVGSTEGVAAGEVFFQIVYVSVFAGWVSHMIVHAQERFVRTPLNRSLLVFAGVLLFSAFPALYYENGLVWWLRDLSPLLNYLVFFIFVNTARSEGDLRRPVAVFVAFCYLVTLRDLVSFAFPGAAASRLYYVLDTWVVRGSGGAVFWQSAFFLCLGLLLYETRPGRIASLLASMAFFGATLVVSGTRTYWLSTLFVLALALALGPRLRRGRLRRGERVAGSFRAALLLIGAVALSWFLFEGTGRTAQRLRGRYERLGAVLQGGGEQDLSWFARVLEAQYTLEQVARHPFVGYGLGHRIPFRGTPGARGGEHGQIRQTLFLHNGYLFMLLKLGALGLVVFLWFLVRLMRMQWDLAVVLDDPPHKGLAFGFFLSLVGIAVMSLTTSKFADAPTTLFVGVFSGVLCTRARWENGADNPQHATYRIV